MGLIGEVAAMGAEGVRAGRVSEWKAGEWKAGEEESGEWELSARERFDAEILREAVLSDELYFQLGACRKTLTPGELVWAPGLTGIGAGCVVQGVKFESIPSRPGARTWIAQVEEAVAGTGAALSRIYVEHDAEALSAAMLEAGYVKRHEIVYWTGAEEAYAAPQLRFSRVESARDREARKRLYESIEKDSEAGSDGYRSGSSIWLELMARKEAGGELEPYLIWSGEQVAGEVSLMAGSPILRLKNLVVGPDQRGQGIGAGIVAWARHQAFLRGKRQVMALGVEGCPGSRLYRRTGMQEAGIYTEFSKSLRTQ
jgi:GNAT superfamily N-acetyltransferase